MNDHDDDINGDASDGEDDHYDGKGWGQDDGRSTVMPAVSFSDDHDEFVSSTDDDDDEC